MRYITFLQNGILSSLPYIAMWIFSIVASCVADWLIYSGRLSLTRTRKVFNCIGNIFIHFCVAAKKIFWISFLILFDYNKNKQSHNIAIYRVIKFHVSPEFRSIWSCVGLSGRRLRWLQSRSDCCTFDFGCRTQWRHLLRIQSQPPRPLALFGRCFDEHHQLFSQHGWPPGTPCCWPRNAQQGKNFCLSLILLE